MTGYFRTLGIPMIAGRDFDDRDQMAISEIASSLPAKRAAAIDPMTVLRRD